MLLYLPEILLTQKLGVFRSDKTAFTCNRVDEALSLKLVISSFCGNDTYAKLPGKTADRGEHFICRKLPAYDLGFNLRVDLIVDRRPVPVIDQYVQLHHRPFFIIRH